MMIDDDSEQGLLEMLAAVNERVDRHIQERKAGSEFRMPEPVAASIEANDDSTPDSKIGFSSGGAGNVHIGGYFRRQVSIELRLVCVEREETTGRKCTIQALLAEGINHVLRKAGRQPIANEDVKI